MSVILHFRNLLKKLCNVIIIIYNMIYIYKTEISKHNKKNIKTMLCIQLKLSNQSKIISLINLIFVIK